MAFEIVAKRDSETVTMQRNSSLIAIAKARVWASEGWNVTIVVKDEAAAASAEEYVHEFNLPQTENLSIQELQDSLLRRPRHEAAPVSE